MRGEGILADDGRVCPGENFIKNDHITKSERKKEKTEVNNFFGLNEGKRFHIFSKIYFKIQKKENLIRIEKSLLPTVRALGWNQVLEFLKKLSCFILGREQVYRDFTPPAGNREWHAVKNKS